MSTSDVDEEDDPKGLKKKSIGIKVFLQSFRALFGSRKNSIISISFAIIAAFIITILISYTSYWKGVELIIIDQLNNEQNNISNSEITSSKELEPNKIKIESHWHLKPIIDFNGYIHQSEGFIRDIHTNEASQEEKWTSCTSNLKSIVNKRRSAIKSIGKGNTVVFTVANYAYKDLTHNIIHSWIGVGLDNWFVIALDNQAARWLEEIGAPCYISEEVIEETERQQLEDSQFQGFMSRKYIKFMRSKPWYTNEILKTGTNVLYSDADVVFLSNPMEWMEAQLDHENTDYWAQDDTYMPCGGFYWFRSNLHTVQFFEDVLHDLSKNPKQNEQYAMWDVQKRWNIQEKSLKWRYLPLDLFPNGRVWWRWRRPQRNGAHPIIIHCNWIMGHAIKVFRMREEGIWFVDGLDYYRGKNTGGRFLTFEFGRDEHDNVKADWLSMRNTIRNALALASALNRIIIFPRFPCKKSLEGNGEERYCDVSHWFGYIDIFDKMHKVYGESPGYRESHFLLDKRYRELHGAKRLQIELHNSVLPSKKKSTYRETNQSFKRKRRFTGKSEDDDDDYKMWYTLYPEDTRCGATVEEIKYFILEYYPNDDVPLVVISSLKWGRFKGSSDPLISRQLASSALKALPIKSKDNEDELLAKQNCVWM